MFHLDALTRTHTVNPFNRLVLLGTEEFEALNSPAFEARGAVTDEWITTFKQLWS
jgi:hypothetical protein